MARRKQAAPENNLSVMSLDELMDVLTIAAKDVDGETPVYFEYKHVDSNGVEHLNRQPVASIGFFPIESKGGENDRVTIR
jgi:hypothetical protein